MSFDVEKNSVVMVANSVTTIDLLREVAVNIFF